MKDMTKAMTKHNLNLKRRMRMPDNKPTCLECIHRSVCGPYDALFNATMKIDPYDVMVDDYEDELFQTLAYNCRKYKKERYNA